MTLIQRQSLDPARGLLPQDTAYSGHHLVTLQVRGSLCISPIDWRGQPCERAQSPLCQGCAGMGLPASARQSGHSMILGWGNILGVCPRRHHIQTSLWPKFAVPANRLGTRLRMLGPVDWLGLEGCLGSRSWREGPDAPAVSGLCGSPWELCDSGQVSQSLDFHFHMHRTRSNLLFGFQPVLGRLG